MADRFGRVLLVTQAAGVIALDLYEGPQMIGRGFYLDAPGGEPSIPIREVEVTVDGELLEAIGRETQLPELPMPLEGYEVDYANRPPMRITAHQPDPVRKILTGEISLPDEVLSFQIEEFGSPEPITLIIAIVWAVVCVGGTVLDAIKSCEKKALETCGQGRVKSLKITRSLSIKGCRPKCEFECIDGATPRGPAPREGLMETAPPAAATS